MIVEKTKSDWIDDYIGLRMITLLTLLENLMLKFVGGL